MAQKSIPWPQLQPCYLLDNLLVTLPAAPQATDNKQVIVWQQQLATCLQECLATWLRDNKSIATHLYEAGPLADGQEIGSLLVVTGHAIYAPAFARYLHAVRTGEMIPPSLSLMIEPSALANAITLPSWSTPAAAPSPPHTAVTIFGHENQAYDSALAYAYAISSIQLQKAKLAIVIDLVLPTTIDRQSAAKEVGQGYITLLGIQHQACSMHTTITWLHAPMPPSTAPTTCLGKKLYQLEKIPHKLVKCLQNGVSFEIFRNETTKNAP